jgi:hypothetical protein
MVSRRVRDHVASHNWFAVGVDLAIVVAGVFLGMQVNNWNQARLENEQARDYQRRLISELDFNARQYAEQAHYFRQVRANGTAAVAALDDPSVSAADLLIYAYQLSQMDEAPPKAYIYKEMAASGLVSRLGDEQLQDVASDYYLNIDAAAPTMVRMSPYRELIRSLIPASVQSLIRQRCGDRMVMYKGRIVGLHLVDNCHMPLDSPIADAAAREIRDWPGMHREMTRYIALTQERIDTIDLNRELTAEFKERLAGVG